MPTTRAPRAAARAAARCLTEVLPADALGLVLYQLPLAHDIAAVAPTCHQFCDAAKLAQKLRPFSGEVVTLVGHTAFVRSVAVTLDGRVVTGSDDRTIKWWRDEACERTIQHHHGVLPEYPYADVQLEMLPDGAFLTLQVTSRTATLWTPDGSLVRTIGVSHLEQHPQRIAVLNGTHFVVGYRADIKLFEMDGTLVRTLKGHTAHVVSFAVMPDGQRFLSGSDDKHIKVWNVDSETCVSSWHAGSQIYALAVTPDGKRILSGDLARTVKVWLLDGTLKRTLLGMHTSGVSALVALPDNQHALSGSKDNTVKLFNVNDGAVLRTFAHHGPARSVFTSKVTCLALMPDGLRFVSGAYDGTARIVYHGLAPIRI